MFKRLVILLFILIGLVSCDKLFSKQNNIDLNQNQTPPIDFSSIDAYPLLPECEQINSRELQQKCFYDFLSKRIELELSKKDILLTSNYTDTIQVNINVSSKGFVSVKSIILSNENNFKELKQVIIQSVGALPQIQPAIKAGIPVTTEFVLPIILIPSKNIN